MFFGTYTKRVSVTGQLIPDTGVVKVYSPQPGVVIEKKVSEGKKIIKGDLLYVLSSERQSTTIGDVQAAISSRVREREHAMHEERAKKMMLQSSELEILQKKGHSLEAQLSQLESEITDQKNRISLLKKNIERYENLLSKEYISREQLEQKQEDLLDQSGRLKELQRSYINIEQELIEQQADLSTQKLKNQNDISQFDREISSAIQELTESEGKRKLNIVAPESGIATAVSGETGQATEVSKPILSIVSEGAVLQANLYVASRAIGFVKPGNHVLLRYQPFPYQKFGQSEGTVISVSKTAIPTEELNFTPAEINSDREPLYLVTVKLGRQYINAYGKRENLQAGMLLDADILQETRRLYEWVLEPLYSLSGKL